MHPRIRRDYLERNAEHRAVNHWDPTLLDRKLKQGGFGLLIVERDTVFEVIKPVEQTPSPETSCQDHRRVASVPQDRSGLKLTQLSPNHPRDFLHA